MARPLTNLPPMSSVSRLLEPGAGRAALAEPVREPPAPAQPTGETPRVKREFLLTGSADETLGDLTALLSKATGTDVTNSHFLRAVLLALRHALPEVEREAWQVGGLRRPSNARGREAEREAYERALAAVLLRGLRASRPPE